ncbi:hypothetical protein ACN9M0_31815 [Streptomyces sp. R-07]|uniref:hypothetical protein n=1 Tax=Streptomyces sp. R-07 TaxID=3404052 RepID=UPI003CED239F
MVQDVLDPGDGGGVTQVLRLGGVGAAVGERRLAQQERAAGHGVQTALPRRLRRCRRRFEAGLQRGEGLVFFAFRWGGLVGGAVR